VPKNKSASLVLSYVEVWRIVIFRASSKNKDIGDFWFFGKKIFSFAELHFVPVREKKNEV